MRRGLLVAALILIYFILFAILPGRAPAATAPASAKTVAWASACRAQAVKERNAVCWAAVCLGRAKPARLATLPAITQGEGVWRDAGNAFVRSTARLRAKLAVLLWHMDNPKGHAISRWLPAAKFAGWAKGQWRDLLTCIRRESGGNRRASNGICRGLTQIHVCHAAEFLRVTGRRYFNGVYEALANLRFAHWLWLREGWRPWTSMVGY